jgi:hypothetical protein
VNSDDGNPLSLPDRRRAVQRELAEHRLQISRQLEPAATFERAFPRSLTMRLVTRYPVPAVKLLAGLALPLLGGRGLAAATVVAAVLDSALVRARLTRGNGG